MNRINQVCEICEANGAASAHHAVPREINPHCAALGLIFVCHDCEKLIHSVFTNEELAFQFNTIDRIRDELEARIKIFKYENNNNYNGVIMGCQECDRMSCIGCEGVARMIAQRLQEKAK